MEHHGKHYGPIGWEVFSAFEASASVEKIAELLYSHLPPVFGSPRGFYLEQESSTRIRRVEVQASASKSNAANKPKDLPIPGGIRSYQVGVTLKLHYMPETDLPAVMLVRAIVDEGYQTYDSQQWQSYEKKFRDIDEAFEEVKRIIG